MISTKSNKSRIINLELKKKKQILFICWFLQVLYEDEHQCP